MSTNAMNEITKMTKEAIEAKIDSGEPQFLNDYIQGKIQVGEPDEVKPEDQSQTDKKPDEQIVVPTKVVADGDIKADTVDHGIQAEANKQNKQDELPVEQAAEPEAETEAEKFTRQLKEKDELNDMLRKKRMEDQQDADSIHRRTLEEVNAYKLKYEEVQAQLHKMADQIDTNKETTQEVELLPEEEGDDYLATPFSRNNRTMLNELKKELGSNAIVTKLEKQFNELAKQQQEAKATQDAQEAKRQNTRARKELFEDVRYFQSRNEAFQTKKDPSALSDDYGVFRSEVKGFIKSDEPREISRAMDSLVHGNLQADEEFRQRAIKEGVKIPEEMDKFLMISELVDMQRGVEYNKFTGKYDKLTDSNGRQVSQRSLDDAYKVSHFFDKVNQIRRDTAVSYQKKQDHRGESAITLTNQDVAKDGTNTDMTLERAKELLDTPERMYRNNSELAKQVKQAYSKAGVVMPVRGGGF